MLKKLPGGRDYGFGICLVYSGYFCGVHEKCRKGPLFGVWQSWNAWWSAGYNRCSPASGGSVNTSCGEW